MITRDWRLDLQVLWFNSAINSAIATATAVAIGIYSAIAMAIGAHTIILCPDSELGEGGVVGGGPIPIPVTNAVAIVVVVVVVVAHHRVSETEHRRPEASKRG